MDRPRQIAERLVAWIEGDVQLGFPTAYVTVKKAEVAAVANRLIELEDELKRTKEEIFGATITCATEDDAWRWIEERAPDVHDRILEVLKGSDD
jgi:sugar-specific transcriptional regulator TrmB